MHINKFISTSCIRNQIKKFSTKLSCVRIQKLGKHDFAVEVVVHSFFCTVSKTVLDLLYGVRFSRCKMKLAFCIFRRIRAESVSFDDELQPKYRNLVTLDKDDSFPACCWKFADNLWSHNYCVHFSAQIDDSLKYTVTQL